VTNPTAKQLAVKWLAASDKTEAELRTRLQKRGYPEAEITSALRDLAQGRWLDDQRVLEREIEQSIAHPGIGREKTRATLLKRGLDEEIVENSLIAWSEEDETAKAAAFLEARLKPEDAPARAARMLVSRGFSEEAVRSALERRFPDWES
jgi:regulatory protein